MLATNRRAPATCKIRVAAAGAPVLIASRIRPRRLDGSAEIRLSTPLSPFVPAASLAASFLAMRTSSRRSARWMVVRRRALAEAGKAETISSNFGPEGVGEWRVNGEGVDGG